MMQPFLLQRRESLLTICNIFFVWGGMISLGYLTWILLGRIITNWFSVVLWQLIKLEWHTYIDVLLRWSKRVWIKRVRSFVLLALFRSGFLLSMAILSTGGNTKEVSGTDHGWLESSSVLVGGSLHRNNERKKRQLREMTSITGELQSKITVL